MASASAIEKKLAEDLRAFLFILLLFYAETKSGDDA